MTKYLIAAVDNNLEWDEEGAPDVFLLELDPVILTRLAVMCALAETLEITRRAAELYDFLYVEFSFGFGIRFQTHKPEPFPWLPKLNSNYGYVIADLELPDDTITNPSTVEGELVKVNNYTVQFICWSKSGTRYFTPAINIKELINVTETDS